MLVLCFFSWLAFLEISDSLRRLSKLCRLIFKLYCQHSAYTIHTLVHHPDNSGQRISFCPLGFHTHKHRPREKAKIKLFFIILIFVFPFLGLCVSLVKNHQCNQIENQCQLLLLSLVTFSHLNPMEKVSPPTHSNQNMNWFI